MNQHPKHTPVPRLEIPIPEIRPLNGWKEIPIVKTKKSHEPLVPIGIFSEYPTIYTSSVYAHEHSNSPYIGGLKGSTIAIFIRRSVADRLKEAQCLLPRGMHFMVMDAYRSLDVQAVLYEQYCSGVQNQHPDWSSEKVSTESQKYISVPSRNPSQPSPHSTGASVDILIIRIDETTQTILDEIDERLSSLDITPSENHQLQTERSSILQQNAEMLDFGTRFDHGGAAAALRYLEDGADRRELNEIEKTQLSHRRLLYQTMTAAGFEPYSNEWWHYNDPASQMGAKTAGISYAEYGIIDLSDENRAFAHMRKQRHLNIPSDDHDEAIKKDFTSNTKETWYMADIVDKLEPPSSKDSL